MRPALLGCALLAPLAACPPSYGPDTCSGGENMSNVRLDPGAPPSPGAARVELLFDPGTGVGARLPDGYYAAAVAEDHQGADGGSVVSSVSLVTTGRLRLELERELGAGVGTRLRLPDRRQFIDCRHPGQEDRYYLDVAITSGLSDGGYQLTASQSVDVGAI